MVVATRASAPAVDPATVSPFEHVLFLLGCGTKTENPDHPIRRLLQKEQINDIGDIYALNPTHLENIRIEDEDGHYVHVPMGFQQRLCAPVAYRDCFNAVDESHNFTAKDWLNVTLDEFNDFFESAPFSVYYNRGNILALGTNAPSFPTRATPGASLSSGARPVSTALDAFKKTIKRDPAQFTVFSDRRLWASWHLQFTATARAQDLQDVLNPKYFPTDIDTRAVFQAKNEYLFSVFVSKLTTDEGKTLVRAYSKTFDAQKIYSDLCDYYTTSTHAELSASTILTFLTTFKLGTDRWKGKTVSSFLTYYVEQLRLYDDMMSGGRGLPLTDDFKRTALDSAVQAIDDLRAVRITQSTLCQHLGKVPTFGEYFSLLESAAVTYDAQQGAHTARPPVSSNGSRRVYMADAYLGEPEDLLSDPGPTYDAYPQGLDEDFNVDTPLSTVTAFAAAQSRTRTSGTPMDPSIRLSDSIFSQLTVDDRRTWSRLGREARRLILGGSGTPSSVGGISSVNRRVLMADHFSSPGVAPPAPVPLDTAPANAPPASEPLLAMLTDRRPSHHPGDLRRLLSPGPTAQPNHTRTLVSATAMTPALGEDFETPDGLRYRRIHMSVTTQTPPTYHIANAKAATRHSRAALVDRGANGGLAGSDCRIISRSADRFVNVEGIDKHQLENIPIVSCGAYSLSRHHGPVILIFHQFAGMMRGPTILSAGQLESYSNKVNDRALRIDNDGQRIITNDGFEFPLHVRQGLPYLDMRPYTDIEWDTYPHVIMTSDVDWDPSILDGEFPLTHGQEEFFDASTYDNGTNFDAYGTYRKGTIVASARTVMDDPILQGTVLPNEMLVTHEYPPDVEAPDIIPKIVDAANNTHSPETTDVQTPDLPSDPAPVVVFKNISPHVAQAEPDPATLRPFFAFLPTEVVERTLQATTQYARVPMSESSRRFFKSPFPALNVARRNEDLLTDVVYSDTPAIDDGSTSAAVYSGRISHVMDVYGMKTDKQFVNTLEDIIHERGDPTRLLSDHAILIGSNRVADILRAYCTGQWTSEPHHPIQNTMEQRYCSNCKTLDQCAHGPNRVPTIMLVAVLTVRMYRT